MSDGGVCFTLALVFRFIGIDGKEKTGDHYMSPGNSLLGRSRHEYRPR
jgi:hypothetical protein